MKLNFDGKTEKINRYYVQTLCMIFFPGAKFPEDEIVTADTPILNLTLQSNEEKVTAIAHFCLGEKKAEATRESLFSTGVSEERTYKLAIGSAVIAAGGELMKYKPSWGMLVGVRPSKVAMEMLNSGMSKTRVKKTLSGEYFVTPKKAGLAVDVARKEKGIIGIPSPRDCSIYISVPFCPSRCSYCSFVSYTSERLLSLIPEYLIRLCRDIDRIFETVKRLGLHVKTVYVGGGTPTILSVPQMEMLLSTVTKNIDPASLEEFTYESGRPDTITAEKMTTARKFGVTRVCVNSQSLSENVLSKIGRAHTPEDFYQAYHIVRESGIRCINTDLIAGLPGDRFATFSATFDKILELSPENITVHTFCVKKSADILRADSHIYSISGGDVGKCVDYSQLRSVQNGYLPYYMYRQKNTIGNFENVGFSKEGYEGLYNVYMMEEVHSIFAAGAGAVTKLVDYKANEGGKIEIERVFNDKYPYEYLREDQSEKINAAICGYYEKKNLI